MSSFFLLTFLLIVCYLHFGNTGQVVTVWVNDKPIRLGKYFMFHFELSISISSPCLFVDHNFGYDLFENTDLSERRAGMADTYQTSDGSKTVYLADMICGSCDRLVGPVRRHNCRKKLCDSEESENVQKKIQIL